MEYKIAVVVPTITAISGNRTAFLLARELNNYAMSTLICYEIAEEYIETVQNLVSPARLYYKQRLIKKKDSVVKGLADQFLRKRDRALSKFILEKNRFDAVIVISNEGKYLSYYLKTENPGIITAISIMELNDHFIFIPYENKKQLAIYRQFLFSFPYGILHYYEKERYDSFDLIFANSSWTSILFQYLYNINVAGNIIILDNKLFRPIEIKKHLNKFIALPTVSLKLDKIGRDIAIKLVNEGIPIISYGGFKIEGIPYLGYLDTEDMVQLLSDASGTLFLFDYEALGLVPFESLACGTKVITYNHQGPAAELGDNNNVFFCNNYNEIKDACLNLLSRNKNKQDIENCIDSVMKYFPENTTIKIFDSIKTCKEKFNGKNCGGFL